MRSSQRWGGSGSTPSIGGPAAEHDAGREVLDLALAVDGRVGDDRDRLLEVVRERHRHRRERPQRPVPAQGADRLGAAVGVELELLLVALDPAGRGQQGLQLELGLEDLVLVAVLLDRDRLEAARQAGARLGGGQGAAALGAAVDLALHVGVVEHDRHAVLAGQEGDLLARRQRGGVARELGDRDDARLGGDDVELVGLDPPERAQAHGVHREDHLVGGSRGQRDRPLGVRAQRLAVVDVEVLELRRQAVDLAEDRRQGELDRLQQREALLEDQALEQAVEVLAVGAVARDRQAELLALLAELGDRVDLAVVAEDRERLHPAEGRVRVRRVAVVGDDPRGGEVLLLHLGVEARDHLGLPLDLVDRVVGRERGDVAVDLSLDGDHGAVAGARRRGAGLAGQAGDLPEDRRRLGRPRAQGATVDRALAAPDHLEAVLAQQRQDERHAALGLGGRVEEDVGDREARLVRRRRVEALRLQPPPPGGPRQVHHQPAAVALAVHAAGAVDHQLERLQRPLEHGPARPAVAGREARQGAGVVLLELGEPAGRDGGEWGRSGHPQASESSVRRNMVIDRRSGPSGDAGGPRSLPRAAGSGPDSGTSPTPARTGAEPE